ncbi:hypothetical protein ACPPVT_09685 [Angustibacter sp. McL0619]|uniref:hypothetical protein n=1 Tax=Angustibacter sp. McL0619 TaxID=3415676 RepID=UPI003CF0B24A
MAPVMHEPDRPTLAPVSYPSAQRPWWLIVLETFVAVQAVYGGISLVLGVWDLDRRALQRLPILNGWTLPGLSLVVVVAVPMLTAAWLETWAHPKAGLASLVAGSLLMGWIALQLVLLPTMRLWLQPVCFVAGAVVAGASLHRLRHRRTR